MCRRNAIGSVAQGGEDGTAEAAAAVEAEADAEADAEAGAVGAKGPVAAVAVATASAHHGHVRGSGAGEDGPANGTVIATATTIGRNTVDGVHGTRIAGGATDLAWAVATGLVQVGAGCHTLARRGEDNLIRSNIDSSGSVMARNKLRASRPDNEEDTDSPRGGRRSKAALSTCSIGPRAGPYRAKRVRPRQARVGGTRARCRRCTARLRPRGRACRQPGRRVSI